MRGCICTFRYSLVTPQRGPVSQYIGNLFALLVYYDPLETSYFGTTCGNNGAVRLTWPVILGESPSAPDQRVVLAYQIVGP